MISMKIKESHPDEPGDRFDDVIYLFRRIASELLASVHLEPLWPALVLMAMPVCGWN